MSADNYGYIKLTPQEIDAMLEANYGWKLDDGVLICLRIKPGTYDWSDHKGNDFPVRIRADCKVAIKNGALHEYEEQGVMKVRRDDLIPFCNEITCDCNETYEIWRSYKARKGHKQFVKGLTEKRQAMDKAFQEALLEEYLSKKSLYDANPNALNKSALCRRILKKHPEWELETLRVSSKDIGIAWAKTAAKEKI